MRLVARIVLIAIGILVFMTILGWALNAWLKPGPVLWA
jgi:hypothetical protein